MRRLRAALTQPADERRPLPSLRLTDRPWRLITACRGSVRAVVNPGVL
jgi:hypothetical protein